GEQEFGRQTGGRQARSGGAPFNPRGHGRPPRSPENRNGGFGRERRGIYCADFPNRLISIGVSALPSAQVTLPAICLGAMSDPALSATASHTPANPVAASTFSDGVASRFFSRSISRREKTRSGTPKVSAAMRSAAVLA